MSHTSTVTNFASMVDWRAFTRSTPRLLLLGAGVGCAGALLTATLAGRLSPWVTLVAMLGLAAGCGMLLSPKFAFLMLCFSLPFERIGRLTEDFDTVTISANRILGVVALASLLLHAALRKQKLRFGWPFALYAGYTVMALLSYCWAYSPKETFRQCFAILGNLLFFFLVVNFVRSYSDAKRAVVVWLLATMAAGIFSLGDYYLATRNMVSDAEMGLTKNRMMTVVNDGAEVRSLGMNVRRLFGTTAHPTLFGLNMTMAGPFFLWALGTHRGARKLFWFAGLLIALFCMVLSNTRAVFLIAIFTVVFSLWRRLWWPNLRAIIAMGVLALAVIPFIPQDVYRRTLDPALYTTAKGDSLRVRFKFWAKSWELIQESWTHGIGVGNQTEIIERVTDEKTGNMSTVGLSASAHNEYIWVMVEVGIVGYLLFWGFVAKVTRASFQAASLVRRVPRASGQYYLLIACQVLMLGILLFAVQSEVFHYPLKAWWLAAGISCSMLEVVRQQVAEATGAQQQVTELHSHKV